MKKQFTKFQIFTIIVTISFALFLILSLSGCQKVSSERACNNVFVKGCNEPKAEQKPAQAVVKQSDSHICGFVGKNKKACTRKVSNDSVYCYQHRDKITDSEVGK